MGAGAWRRRNGGLSLVQCPSKAYGPSVASAPTRARGGSARDGPRPQRERAPQWSARTLHAQATTRSEREGWPVGAGAWRRRNGGLSLVQCPSKAYGPSVASAPTRARGGSARDGPRPQRERAPQWSASALHAQATTRSEREGWPVGAGAWRRRNGGLSLVQCPSKAYGPSVASAPTRARGGSARDGPRPQRERAPQWSASALHAQATTRSEREGWPVGAGAWRRRNGGLSLVQCPSIAYGPSVASAPRRARRRKRP